MVLPYNTYEILTAGELRNKLKGVSNDTPVYVAIDKSDSNYDECGQLRLAHPIERVEREWTCDCNGLDEESSLALILHLADEFYDTYKCETK